MIDYPNATYNRLVYILFLRVNICSRRAYYTLSPALFSAGICLFVRLSHDVVIVISLGEMLATVTDNLSDVIRIGFCTDWTGHGQNYWNTHTEALCVSKNILYMSALTISKRNCSNFVVLLISSSRTITQFVYHFTGYRLSSSFVIV